MFICNPPSYSVIIHILISDRHLIFKALFQRDSVISQSFRGQSFWQELNPRQVDVQADTPNSLTDQVLIATCLYIRIDTKQFLFVYRYVASPGGRLSTKHTPCSSLKSDFKSPTDYRAFLTCQYSPFSALLVFLFYFLSIMIKIVQNSN